MSDENDKLGFSEKLADLINEHYGKDMSADDIISEMEIHLMALKDEARTGLG